MKYDFDLISIGSGSAGRKVALAMHRVGWKTAIVEKDVDGHFAGSCVCSGCVPTKALIEMTRISGDHQKAIAHKERIVERIRSGTLRQVEERTKVPVIRGLATFVDEHTIQVGDDKYTSDIIVIATGSESIIPPIPGLKESNYATSTEILNLKGIPEKLLIIGGGRIGLEFAQLYNEFGSKVTVFEGLPQILPGEDTEMANIIQAHMEKSGITIYTNKFVDEIKEDNRDGNSQFKVILNDGENKGEYTGDYLLVATGRKPATASLKINNMPMPIELNRSAIATNAFMQSNHPNIFAVGDVMGGVMMTNVASYHSGVLIKNLKISRSFTSEWKEMILPTFPSVAYTEPEFASIGFTEEQAKAKYGNDSVVTFKFMNKWLAKSMIVDDWVGVLKGIGIRGSNEIIGAHLFGVRTGSLIQMLVLAKENGLGWKELSEMIYGHPVLAEGIDALSANMHRLTGYTE
jgi:pyruvate/2-oxoglutarate dehydrogenase complex dihydrolipoamide dehydrogenase (E3) component